MDYKKLCEDLKNLEAVAYGYHINGKVLGIDVEDFERIMYQAATAVEKLEVILLKEEQQ